MRQAITWTNADPVHWCIYATLGGDELTLTIWLYKFAFSRMSHSCLRSHLLQQQNRPVVFQGKISDWPASQWFPENLPSIFGPEFPVQLRLAPRTQGKFKITTILQMAFSWMKNSVFWLKFHRCWFDTRGILWHSPESSCTRSALEHINHWPLGDLNEI